MAASRKLVLKTYKSLLREAEKFAAYNFRMYALRRTRDAFQIGKVETDPLKIQNLITDAQKNLLTLQRQTLIHNIYQTDKLVIEKGQHVTRESANGP